MRVKVTPLERTAKARAHVSSMKPVGEKRNLMIASFETVCRRCAHATHSCYTCSLEQSFFYNNDTYPIILLTTREKKISYMHGWEFVEIDS